MKTLLNKNGTQKLNESRVVKMERTKLVEEATLCIINDSVVMREGIKSILSNTNNIEQIITTSKEDYFDKHATNRIDIVITDIEFEKEINHEFIKQIKAISPETEVIVYTRIKNHTHRNISLEAGAKFFIFWEDRFQLLEHVVDRMIHKVTNKDI